METRTAVDSVKTNGSLQSNNLLQPSNNHSTGLYELDLMKQKERLNNTVVSNKVASWTLLIIFIASIGCLVLVFLNFPEMDE